jgi:hypothetical protein
VHVTLGPKNKARLPRCSRYDLFGPTTDRFALLPAERLVSFATEDVPQNLGGTSVPYVFGMDQRLVCVLDYAHIPSLSDAVRP